MDALIALLPLLAINLAIALGAVLFLWLISIPLRDVSIIDMVFGVIMTTIVLASWFIGGLDQGPEGLLVLLVVLWALRMTSHLVQRNWGHGEDPRYSKLRSWVEGEWAFHWLSLRKVFLLQGVVLWLATLPAQMFLLLPGAASLMPLVYLGALLAAFGFAYETIADRQLKTFRADSSLRGTVLQSGLWRYSRHPNYFGELCFWWGIFFLGCAKPLVFLAVVGPLAYSHLVVNVTGQATLDKKLARDKPDYADYMARTNGLIPGVPRSGAKA